MFLSIIFEREIFSSFENLRPLTILSADVRAFFLIISKLREKEANFKKSTFDDTEAATFCYHCFSFMDANN
jgi:hypothetical protein